MTERVIMYINSAQRTTGIPENFTITLGTQIAKVKEVEVFSSEIPYTFYNINNSNNQITWQDNAANIYTATLKNGSYPVATFVTLLQNTMNAQQSGFTITYLKNEFKLQFQNAAAFQINLINTTLANKIGLSADTTLGNLTVLQNVINIGGPKYLLIKSSRLTKPKITRSYLNSTQDDILYKVPVMGSPGDVLVEKNTYTNLLKYGVRQTIKSMDFQLTDENGTVIDLNGLDWSLSVNLILG